MAKEWLQCFEELEVPHTQEPNLISTLGDPVKIRSWQVRVAQGRTYIRTLLVDISLTILF